MIEERTFDWKTGLVELIAVKRKKPRGNRGR